MILFCAGTLVGTLHLPIGSADELGGLSNVIQVSETLVSGGQPTEEGFVSLKDLGVKMVVSVDSARPNVEAAKANGLEYVHIPIGYDTIEADDAAALAKTFRTKAKPIYVHCHHGVHRGRAMAAVAMLLDGKTSNDEAAAFMEKAGTSAEYAGLWKFVEEFDAEQIAGIDPPLHEVAPTPPFAAAMANIDVTWDNLRLFEGNDWKPLLDHPDLSAPHEALQLREALAELAGTFEAPDETFGGLLEEAATESRKLHEKLAAGEMDSVSEAYRALARSCRRCHAGLPELSF